VQIQVRQFLNILLLMAPVVDYLLNVVEIDSGVHVHYLPRTDDWFHHFRIFPRPRNEEQDF